MEWLYKIIVDVFKFLTDVPFNFWFYLLLATAPILVFSAKPESKTWFRIGRLLVAIAVTYVLINLSLHTNYKIGWDTYESCQSQFKDGAIQHHEECGNPPRGIPLAFFAVLGLIPSNAYVGFFELIWRRKHRKQIKNYGKNFKGKWFSNIIIILSIPIWLYMIILVVMGVYILIFPFKNVV
jgi:hypothetical protein